MQQPAFTTPVAKCETLARYFGASTRRFIGVFTPAAEVQAELEAIASRVAAGSLALVSAQGAYRERVLDLIEPRVEVKMVDLKADDIVRSVKRGEGVVDTPVAFGGVVFLPGDMLYADEDGIAVLPAPDDEDDE